MSQLFSKTEQQALDTDGLLVKFYERHVHDGVASLPSSLLPRFAEAGTPQRPCVNPNTPRRGYRELERGCADLLTNFVGNLAAVCLFFDNRPAALRLLQSAYHTLNRVVITGDRSGFIGCVCDDVERLGLHIKQLGLHELAHLCQAVRCPSFDGGDNPVDVRSHGLPILQEESKEGISNRLRTALEKGLRDDCGMLG